VQKDKIIRFNQPVIDIPNGAWYNGCRFYRQYGVNTYKGEFFMKKLLSIAALALAVAITGCTTVESTQKFNRMGLGAQAEKAVCFTHVEIPGYYIFGLPIITGSPKGDGEWSLFRYNQTTTNVIYLLTKEAKARQAARVVNVQVHSTERVTWCPFVIKRTIQASGTGVRTRGAALDRAASDYDSQP
jgi:hypothetical protein